MDINYKIEFYSDWHCGSGLSAGADIDQLVIKDKKGLPFIPGKTLKGLILEAVEDLLAFRGESGAKQLGLKQTFGYFEEKETLRKGEAFFTNAELPEELVSRIVSDKLGRFLYRTVTSTAIEPDGVAKDFSLRRMEVVVPCVMLGSILNVPDEFASELQDSLKLIKRLGQSRNRGLGRCQITIAKGGNE
jgi:CRISPR/Cas system CSM-associated protein Csm3 (group 7 of RAMP superfamily)|nr:RAMP superfamily CRISPR-associated protein [uncultured Bacteroides sp.]